MREPAYRYGDFPELFWDLQPDAPVDVENPSILARVIQYGNMEAIRKLVRPEVLRRELSTLFVPEHTRRFWWKVLDPSSSASR